MLSVLSLVMVGCLFVDLVVRRGAQVVAWAKGAEATVAADVKKL
jgi:hypothetical protein